jgi:hypothetical protein
MKSDAKVGDLRPTNAFPLSEPGRILRPREISGHRSSSLYLAPAPAPLPGRASFQLPASMVSLIALPSRLDQRQLANALSSLRKGDFSVRMPAGQSGVEGKIADEFNQLV